MSGQQKFEVDIVVTEGEQVVPCPACKQLVGDPKYNPLAKMPMLPQVEPDILRVRLVPYFVIPDIRPQCPHCKVRFNITFVVKDVKTIAEATAEYKATRDTSAAKLLRKVLDKLIGLKCEKCGADVPVTIE